MLKRLTGYVFALLLVFLVIELVLVGPNEIVDQEKPKPNQDSNLSLREDIEQMMSEIHVIESKPEGREWELWADQAVGMKETNQLNLQNVKANFFNENDLSFVVTGESGSVNPTTKNMSVAGGVVTRSTNGYVFRTEAVNYNSRQKFLSSSSEVEVTGPHESQGKPLAIRGTAFEADLMKGVILIQKDVKAEKTVAGGREIAVMSNSAEVSSKNKFVKFTGDVVIDIEGTQVKGPDATFHYDSEGDILKMIELAGGVHVRDSNKWATSEKLRINLAENRYIFDGNPRVVQDNDEVSGDRIIFLDGGKKVKVENAKIRVTKESLEKASAEKGKK